ncbi:caspase, EACC1-associated type [Nonomuraea glycinis]|uniref:caspase, EACC1-associated type n=1 Tax=Nonomuraea glycinis TaxID=2047744 RepID=UPI002E168644|nr:caspase family protein [Nonomuraea glycinis]
MATEPTLLLGASGARALIVGSGSYVDGSRLTPVPSVATTVEDLAACLTGVGGLDPAHLVTLVDPADPATLLAALIKAMDGASDVFLFYYVGHGLQDDLGEDLHLATHATNKSVDAVPLLETLPYATLKRTLARCSAERVVVALDCCFSGMAQASRGNSLYRGFDNVRAPGAYLLASSSHHVRSFAPSGNRHTAFSGELIRVLTEGDPAGPPLLTLDYLYRSLVRSLPAKGFPLPYREVADLGDRVPLAPNLSYLAENPPPPPPLVDGDDQESPYRGLASFGPEDMALFFGREEVTAKLVDRALRESLLVVTGPSGSGKSSLLRAGLAPELGRLGSQCMIMMPGGDPLGELDRRLPHDELPDRAVIIVDQLEELFTAPVTDAERAAFLRKLTDLPATVVLSLRSDFFGACTTFPELERAMSRPLLVTPLTAVQQREAIEGPARVAGLSMEEGLVDLLLEDLAGSSDIGTLPLLSHALLETWRHRDGRILTLAAYRAVGGIRRSLAVTADATLGDLLVGEQEIAHRLMLRLVYVGEVTETRRRLPLSQLPPDSDAVERVVLAKFVQARLVTVTEDTAEIAHEALIQAWPQLQNWISNDRARILAAQRLAEDAEIWQRHNRDPAYLYSGRRLAAAEAAIPADQFHDLPGPALDFLRQGITQSAWQRRLRRGAVTILAISLVCALGAGFAALRLAAQNAEERDLAVAGQLAGSTNTLSDLTLRAQLGLTAFRIADTPETKGALIAAAHLNPGMRIAGQNGSVSRLAFTPDGVTLATGSQDSSVRLWNVKNPSQPDLTSTVKSSIGGITGLAFSGDGKLMAVSGLYWTIELWDVSNLSHPVLLSRLNASGAGGKAPSEALDKVARYSAVTFSPRLRILATSFVRFSGETTVKLWNVDDPRKPIGHDVVSSKSSVGTLAISADSILAIGRADGTTALYDVGDTTDPRTVGTLRGHTGAVRAVAFDSAGDTLATASDDKTVRLWDVGKPSLPTYISRMEGFTDGVSGVAITGDGHYAATKSGTSISVWDISDRLQSRHMSAITQYGGATDIVFRPDGGLFATGSDDALVRLWNTADIQAIGGLGRLYSGGNLMQVAFTRNGRILANASGNGSVELADTTDPLHPIPLAILKGQSSWIKGVALHPDGKFLATASSDGTSQLWDIHDVSRPEAVSVIKTATLPGTSPSLSGVSLSHDRHLLALSHGIMAELWDVTDLRHPVVKAQWAAHRQNLGGGVAFSPVGPVLATGSDDFTIKLWDVRDAGHPKELATLHGHTAKLITMAFSDDGKTLATGGVDGTVRVWDVTHTSSPKIITVLRGHTRAVFALTLSHDGKRLASGSQDQSVRLWDIHNPAQPILYAVFREHGASVGAIAFTQNDRFLATGASNSSLRLWRLDPDWAAQQICKVSGAALSREEWHVYVPGRDYTPPCSP